MSAKSAASAARRRQAISRRDSSIPPLARTVTRKGRAPQKVGIYGRTSMYYSTMATIDRRWDHTVSNQDAL